MRDIIVQNPYDKGEKHTSATQSTRANNAMNIEATSLQYYQKCTHVVIRAQRIHAMRWRPLPQNTSDSNLFALPLHRNSANKMQRPSWISCWRCPDEAQHAQTMPYIRIAQNCCQKSEHHVAAIISAYRTQNRNTQARKAHLLTSYYLSALRFPLARRKQNTTRGY